MERNELYFEIDETMAKRAKEGMSFDDYNEGSATREYRACVDVAIAIAEQQKAETGPEYHEKIDRLVASYAKRLAENTNARLRIDASVPSVMIVGAGNFPWRKKERQMQLLQKVWTDRDAIADILDRIRAVGTGGISSDDPNAIEKIQSKIEELKRNLDRSIPNTMAEIRRLKSRIEEIKRRDATDYPEWEFSGGRVVINREANRLQLLFDGKPSEEIRSELKKHGFRWAPSMGAWQRQLTRNAMWTAKRMPILKKIEGEPVA